MHSPHSASTLSSPSATDNPNLYHQSPGASSAKPALTVGKDAEGNECIASINPDPNFIGEIASYHGGYGINLSRFVRKDFYTLLGTSVAKEILHELKSPGDSIEKTRRLLRKLNVEYIECILQPNGNVFVVLKNKEDAQAILARKIPQAYSSHIDTATITSEEAQNNPLCYVLDHATMAQTYRTNEPIFTRLSARIKKANSASSEAPHWTFLLSRQGIVPTKVSSTTSDDWAFEFDTAHTSNRAGNLFSQAAQDETFFAMIGITDSTMPINTPLASPSITSHEPHVAFSTMEEKSTLKESTYIKNLFNPPVTLRKALSAVIAEGEELLKAADLQNRLDRFQAIAAEEMGELNTLIQKFNHALANGNYIDALCTGQKII